MAFRFETLLRVKHIKENIALQDLARAQKQHFMLQEYLTYNRQAVKNLTENISQQMIDGMKSSDHQLCQKYLSFLDDKEKELQQQLASSSNELDQKREKMLQARKELKAILRLKEIELDRQTTSDKKQEMRFIDEIAIIKHGSNP